MVDVADSKSADGDIVWVRVPPPAPRGRKLACGHDFLCLQRKRRHPPAPLLLLSKSKSLELGCDLNLLLVGCSLCFDYAPGYCRHPVVRSKVFSCRTIVTLHSFCRSSFKPEALRFGFAFLSKAAIPVSLFKPCCYKHHIVRGNLFRSSPIAAIDLTQKQIPLLRQRSMANIA